MMAAGVGGAAGDLDVDGYHLADRTDHGRRCSGHFPVTDRSAAMMAAGVGGAAGDLDVDGYHLADRTDHAGQRDPGISPAGPGIRRSACRRSRSPRTNTMSNSRGVAVTGLTGQRDPGISPAGPGIRRSACRRSRSPRTNTMSNLRRNRRCVWQEYRIAIPHPQSGCSPDSSQLSAAHLPPTRDNPAAPEPSMRMAGISYCDPPPSVGVFARFVAAQRCASVWSAIAVHDSI